MAAVYVNRRDLVGRSQSNTGVLEALIRANALNCTGKIDYNKYGILDCIGFKNVSEKFVDNFLFGVLVPDYDTKENKKIRKNTFVGSQNVKIRELLNANGLEKCNVKAIHFVEVGTPQIEMLEKMAHVKIDKEVKTYYEQIFKIACPNNDYGLVMNFLREIDYNKYGFFLKDIDITMDYSGSFDKYKCIDHLTTLEDFREQGSIPNGEQYPRTIVDTM